MSNAVASTGSKIIKSLIADGIVPPMCTRFELSAAVHEVVRIKCEFFVSEEQFEKIATAFRDNPDEAKAMARTLLIQRKGAVGNPQDVEVVKVDLEDGI
jgi:hypothetical protein